jgi:hypothetical protein
MTTPCERISRMLLRAEKDEQPDIGDVVWFAIGVRLAMYADIPLEKALVLPADWRLKVKPRRIEGSAPVEIIPRD